MEKINALEPIDSKMQMFDVVYQNASDILKKAKEMAGMIVSEQSFKMASGFRKTINAMKKEAIASLEDIRIPAYNAYQAILRKRDEVTVPFDEAMKALDAPMAAWYDQQERIRKEKEAQAQAELKRQQDEAKLNAAIAAEQAGNQEKAQAILDKPMAIPAVQLPKTQAEKGVTFSKIYLVNESNLDLKVLISAVCAGKVPEEALLPNLKFLNAQARALKENLNYPGITITVKTNVSSRS